MAPGAIVRPRRPGGAYIFLVFLIVELAAGSDNSLLGGQAGISLFVVCRRKGCQRTFRASGRGAPGSSVVGVVPPIVPPRPSDKLSRPRETRGSTIFSNIAVLPCPIRRSCAGFAPRWLGRWKCLPPRPREGFRTTYPTFPWWRVFFSSAEGFSAEFLDRYDTRGFALEGGRVLRGTILRFDDCTEKFGQQ